tara:strand:- start:42584 stop:43285 length:702 start_codon:yes stop_codon:yes gene_type:complete
MKLAIMQPYIFPYIGYFNLVHSVDKLIFYDDVSFISRGWINRNKILSNKKEFLFSIPLVKASRNKLINEVAVLKDPRWKAKFLKTLKHSYSREKNFINIYPLVEEIVNHDAAYISDLAIFSITKISEYLGLKRDFSKSSDLTTVDKSKKGTEKILDICKQEHASVYNNAIGGMELYNRDVFKSNAIDINFVKPNIISYDQGLDSFLSHLSIIDILMFNSKKSITDMIKSYSLI